MDVVVYMDETEAELLRLLNGPTSEQNARDFSFREIKKLWGRGERQTYRRIEELIADGKMECVKGQRKNKAGYQYELPVYRFK